MILHHNLNCIQFCNFQMSEAAMLSMVENSLADILFHVENEGKLPDFTNWNICGVEDFQKLPDFTNWCLVDARDCVIRGHNRNLDLNCWILRVI